MIRPIEMVRLCCALACLALWTTTGCSTKPKTPPKPATDAKSDAAAKPETDAKSDAATTPEAAAKPDAAPTPDGTMTEEPAKPEAPAATDSSAAPAHGDHDHLGHEPPATLADGVVQLTKLAAQVKEHIATDGHEAADETVHDLGHLLEDLRGLVTQSTLTTDAKKSAERAIDDLTDCFDKLDAALHAETGAGEPPAQVHAAVAVRIEAALQSLGELN